jgi:tetraacyldisaccharide 4'-kinase
VDELEAEVIVMDDGFQHRRLHRDLDIVVLDATCPFGFGYQLPRGYLREPISSLRRASLVLLTRTDQVSEPTIAQIEQIVRQHHREVPIVRTRHRPSGICGEDGSSEPIEAIRSQNVALFSAIGNPEAFKQTVEDCGAMVTDHFRLPDHDSYDRQARDRLRDWLAESKAKSCPDRLICTHKDFVKIHTDRIVGVSVSYLEISLELSSPGAFDLIETLLRDKAVANS